MEKEQNRYRFGRGIVLGTFLTAAMLGVASSDSEGHQQYNYSPIPNEDFKPLEIQERSLDKSNEINMDNSPGEKVIVVFPSPSQAPEPLSTPFPTESPALSISTPKPEVQKLTPKPKTTNRVSSGGWILDKNVSWYGPGFYGHRTACGEILTKTLIGVANKTLPCGTLVDFKYKGSDGVTREIIAPVVDRGPYVTGRQWDLTGGLAVFLHHTYTGSIYYDILGK